MKNKKLSIALILCILPWIKILAQPYTVEELGSEIHRQYRSMKIENRLKFAFDKKLYNTVSRSAAYWIHAGDLFEEDIEDIKPLTFLEAHILGIVISGDLITLYPKEAESEKHPGAPNFFEKEFLKKIYKIQERMEKEPVRKDIREWYDKHSPQMIEKIKLWNSGKKEEAQMLHEKMMAEYGEYPSVIFTSICFQRKFRVHPLSFQITGVWKIAGVTGIRKMAEERLKKDSSDLPGLLMKLDCLVLAPRVEDVKEIESILFQLKLRYYNPLYITPKEVVFKAWYRLMKRSYEEILDALKSGNAEKIAALQAEMKTTDKKGMLPSCLFLEKAGY